MEVIKMTTYCGNVVKLIRLVGNDYIQFQIWHTGQILTKPINEFDGLTFEAIRKLKKEGKAFKEWHAKNA